MKKFLLLILIAVCFVGCKTTEPVAVHDTIYRYNNVYIDKYILDSIYIHDSTYIKEKGDTIYITKNHDIYKYLYKHDTINSVDTAYIHDEYPVEVEKKVNRIPAWWVFIFILTLGVAVFSIWELINKKYEATK